MKKLITLFLCCFFSLSIDASPSPLWERTAQLTAHLEGRLDFAAKLVELKTLVSPALLKLATEQAALHPGESYVFHDENGDIYMSPERILVTNSAGAELFKFMFHTPDSPKALAPSSMPLPVALSKEAGHRLTGVRIILDSITEHRLMQDKLFGPKTFTEFTKDLHRQVRSDLEKEGATVVSIIRPVLDHEGKPKSLATILAEQNETATPFSVALSLQFSADDEDFLVTFFDGNIGVGELKTETSKSSFVYRLLTGKVVNSSLLSKCLSCSLKAGLEEAHYLGSKTDTAGKPLVSSSSVTQESPTGRTHFEGNARALTKAEFTELSGSAPEVRMKVETLRALSPEDPHEDYELGFAARDLWTAKFTATSSTVIFPNITVFQKGDIEENILKYSKSIVEGLIKFVQ